MPEGFKSIADLQVVVDANTEKLNENLTLAHNIVERFAGEGSAALTKFDSAVAIMGSGLKVALGPIGAAITAMQVLQGVWDKYGERVQEQAEARGMGAEFKAIKEAAADLGQTLGEAIPGTYKVARQAALDYFTGSKEKNSDLQESLKGTTATLTTDTPKAFAAATDAARLPGEAAKSSATDAANAIQAELPKAYQASTAAALAAHAATAAAAKQNLDTTANLTRDTVRVTGEWVTTVETDVPAAYKSSGDAITQSYEQLKQVSREAASKQKGDAQEVADQWQEIARKVTDTFEIMSAGVKRVYKSEDELSVKEMNSDLKLAENNLAVLGARIQETSRMGPNVVSRALGIDQATRETEEFMGEFVKLLAMRDRLNVANTDKALGSWDVKTLSTLEEQLTKETEAIRRRFETIGMEGPELDAWNERERIRVQLSALGRDAMDSEAEAIRRKIGLVYGLKQAQMDAAQDKKQDEDDDRQEKQVGRAIGNMDGDVRSIEKKTNALMLGNAEAARLAEIEKITAEIRRAGREPNDEEIAQISAKADGIYDLTIAYDEMKEKIGQLQSAGQVVTRSLDNAFANFARSGKLNVKDMVASMLSDFAMLSFKQGVTGPLTKLLTGGGPEGGSGLLGELFGGFRAEGGPVDPSQAYIVGERGPELFMPQAAGNIVPNHALGGGGSISAHVALTIDARGAYPESIEQIKKAVGDLHNSIPGRVIEVVREAKDRGL